MKKYLNKGTASLFFLNLILMILFDRAQHFTADGLTKGKIILFAVNILTLVLIPLASLFSYRIQGIGYMITDVAVSCVKWVKVNLKKIGMFLVKTMIVFVFSYGMVFLFYTVIKKKPVDTMLLWAVFTSLMILLAAYELRNLINTKLHVVYFVLVMIGGTFATCAIPVQVGVSWDDEVHLKNVQETAAVLDRQYYEANQDLIDNYIPTLQNHLGYSVEERKQLSEHLNQSYAKRETVDHEFGSFQLSYVSYSPEVIGTWIGRGLSMSYTSTFILGKWMNVLCYAIVTALAIRRMRYAKVLTAVVSLLPTVLFMSASYSYDPWLYGFTIYGFAIFFSYLQADEHELITWKERMKMLFSVVIGCLAKAVYFPILWPLLFLGKGHFKDRADQRKYQLFVVAMAVLTAFTFVLPLLFAGPGSGDTRGTTLVDSAGQLSFILSEPFQYLKIMLRYLIDYLNPVNLYEHVQNYCYMGFGKFSILTCIVILTVALTDREDRRAQSGVMALNWLVGVAGSLVLICTALYISFTELRLNTISGVQPRYLFPFLLPTLYFLLPFGPHLHLRDRKAQLYTIIPMLFMVLSFVLNVGRILTYWH